MEINPIHTVFPATFGYQSHQPHLPPPRVVRLGAHPVSAVEARAGQAGTGDHGPVLSAAGRVGGVEPLGEELAQPRLAAAAVLR